MSTWLSYVVGVLVIFVAIAPTRVLGPVVALLGRFVGPGVVASVSFAVAGYVLHDDPSERARLIGFGEVAVGSLCGAWWVYRRFVPLYRDQAPTSEAASGDR